MEKSILESLGQEVVEIVSPVSICMALTVLLVRLLNPEGNSDTAAIFIASAYYSEKADDSTGTKLAGSVINAAIFVVIVGLMTFVLVLLFKYGCVRFIYAYMGFAGFSIFFFLTGIISLQLIEKAQLQLDAFSFVYFLYNFAVVGVGSLFFWPAPVLLKQGYLVVTGVVTAYMFTFVPEWTTWTLLIAMALYDLYAVLVPGGPLKVLVELAIERDQDIPALIYEGRPTARRNVGPPQTMAWSESQHPARQLQPTPGPQVGGEGDRTNQAGEAAAPSSVAAERKDRLGEQRPRGLEDGSAVQPAAGAAAVEQRNGTESSAGTQNETLDSSASINGTEGGQEGPCDAQSGRDNVEHGSSAPQTGNNVELSKSSRESDGAAADTANGEEQPLLGRDPDNRQSSSSSHAPQGRHALPIPLPAAPLPPPMHAEDDEDDEFGLPDSIKLGLGDFIFYSVLVGRAAMYDILTVFASYLAIVAGLGITLLLLAVAKKALPALPISIALGVSFYFTARLLLEPFLLPLSSNLLMF
ncbi:g3739 [Coccomyxa viridis]|uniref:Presenilin n=1 Tax=Coccomyxa viridis TaxID=1274662 RepID=A0ABP1FQ33_9CHLO